MSDNSDKKTVYESAAAYEIMSSAENSFTERLITCHNFTPRTLLTLARYSCSLIPAQRASQNRRRRPDTFSSARTAHAPARDDPGEEGV